MVAGDVSRPGANLHIHIKGKVSEHANEKKPGKALLMNPAIELHAAGLDRCAINSPFGPAPGGEAKAESCSSGIDSLLCYDRQKGRSDRREIWAFLSRLIKERIN